MASGGLAIASVVRNSPEVLDQYNGTQWESSWKTLWQTLSYQLSHVEWTGAGFWARSINTRRHPSVWAAAVRAGAAATTARRCRRRRQPLLLLLSYY